MGEVQKVHNPTKIGHPSFPFSGLLCFVLGFGLAFSFGHIEMAILLILVLLFFVTQRKKAKSLLIFSLSALLLGLVVGFILCFLPFKTGEREIKGFVISAKNNYFILSNGLHRVYVYEKDCRREVGDYLIVRGVVMKYRGKEFESRFSFAEYLRTSGVFYSLEAKSIKTSFTFPLRLRAREMAFLAKFVTEERGVIDSLLFARRDYSNSTISQASSIGAISFLSGSGIIFGIFIRSIERLFSLRDEKKNESLIVAFVLSLFLLPLFKSKIGAYRVVLTRAIALIFLMSKKDKPAYLDALSFSGILLLAFDPFLAVRSSFLIGYGASIFMNLTKDVPNRFRPNERKVVSFLLLMVFLFPLFNVGGEIKVMGPFFSFIFVPLALIFSLVGFLSFLGVPFISLLSFLAKIVSFIVGKLNYLDLGVPVGSFNSIFLFVYYSLVILFLFFYQKGLSNISKKIAFVSMAVFLFRSLPLRESVIQEVVVINVGQGDAILLRDGFHSVMIDTGGNRFFDIAKEVLIPFFRNEKIYSLDWLIETHQDFDHVGGEKSLCQNFRVKHIARDSSLFPLTVGSMTFENLNTYESHSENESSLVLKTNFMGKKWLFMGDAPISIEEKIIADNKDIDCDILKIGHHGSKTSSSFRFLKETSPELALISAGYQNSYGHPDKSVLHRLDSLGIPYRRTDEEGSIRFRSYFSKPLNGY